MKKTARTIISAVLALSLSVVSCFALPILTANEVDFTATIFPILMLRLTK